MLTYDQKPESNIWDKKIFQGTIQSNSKQVNVLMQSFDHRIFTVDFKAFLCSSLFISLSYF